VKSRALLRYHYGLKVDELSSEEIFELWCEYVFCKEQFKEIKKDE